jgi:streptogramin lyase
VAGAVDPVTCAHTEEKVWTGGCNSPMDMWSWAHLVDGETGAILAMVELEGLSCGGFGPYGGAVDDEGNVWMHQRDAMQIARIDAVTHDVEVWSTPTSGYGITVDETQRPWITAYNMAGGIGAARFDPGTQTWDVVDNHWVAGTSGIQQDASGMLWVAYQQYDQMMSLDGGMTTIDPDTLTFGAQVDLPGTWPKGVSIDLAGRVWAVDVDTDSIYRYDPTTMEIVTLGGFDLPYTYSDMTGWALQNAFCDPAG